MKLKDERQSLGFAFKPASEQTAVQSAMRQVNRDLFCLMASRELLRGRQRAGTIRTGKDSGKSLNRI